MPTEKIVRMRMRAEGEVQGVGFRVTVVRLAARYQLVGYVKNLADETVEIEAQGTALQLNHFIEAVLGLTGEIKVAALHKSAIPPVMQDREFIIAY